MKRVRVLCIDDSALMRRLLTEILSSDPGIEVVGVAADPIVAREKIKSTNPDVLTLDVEMPRMDGLTFLRNLMRLRPMPVVMVSSLTEKGADVTLRALELGAVDFVAKPKIDVEDGLDSIHEELIEKVKGAATARVKRLDENDARALPKRDVPPKLSADAVLARSTKVGNFKTTDRLIAIGSSTGGTEAVRDILLTLPPDAPGIVIAQHIPGVFSAHWAKRLDAETAVQVSEAEDGREIRPGTVHIAPGGRHLIIERSGARWVTRLSDGPPVNRHRPSVDVLFRSVVGAAGSNAIGVLLTGMGDDGARGLLELRECGSHTIAQDEATSVVWGMPGSSVRMGAAVDVLPLGQIATRLLSWARQ